MSGGAPVRLVLLDSFTTDQGNPCWDELQQLGTVEVHPRTTREQIVPRARGAEIVLLNKVVVDAGTLSELNELRYVGVLATGTNVVDVAECRRRSIAVTHVPGYAAPAVAEFVLAAMLHFSRRIALHGDQVLSGEWTRSPDFCFFASRQRELRGKTLVILGAGAIGSTVATLATAFGMNVLLAAVPGGTRAGRVGWDDALPSADFVTLHCPLTSLTAAMVDDSFFERLRPGAVLVNTGRGALISAPALSRALHSGQLGAVALDVLAVEPPPPDEPLLRLHESYGDRVLLTPHMAWGTEEARARLVLEAAENVRAFLRGERRNRVD